LLNVKSELKELLIKLAIPVLIGHLAIIGLSITDIILSGHVSRQDLAGVMLGATLFDLPMMFVLGIFIANSTLASRFHGCDDHEGLNHHYQNTLWLTLPVGISIAGAVFVMGKWVLPALDATAAVKEVASGYLLPMTGTACLLPMLIALRTTLDATGHPRIAMAFNLGGFLLNIPLDYLFINGIGPLPALGGAGCGWATLFVVAAIIAGIHIYLHTTSGLERLRIAGKLRKPHWKTMRQILSLGTPMGAAILAEAGFFHIIPLMAASLGTLALAAHAVAMSFDMTMFIIPLAISQAITIRISNALGKADHAQARHIAKLGIIAVFTIALLQFSFVLSLKGLIPGLYTADTAVAELAASLLLVAAIIRIVDGLHIAGSGVLRGYGKTNRIFVISFSAFWLAGAPIVWLVTSGKIAIGQSQVQGIWLAILAAVTCACAMTLWQVRRTLNRGGQQNN